MDIEIKPLLWQQAWFLPAIGLLVGLLVFSLYRWRLNQLRQRAILLEAVVEQRTHDLREHTGRLLVADEEKSRLLKQLQDKSEAFERQAREDSLTGLANRRSLDEQLAHAFERAVQDQLPLSFALLDIDHFKRINDEYSHAAGDEALRAVAQILKYELEGRGTVARWGGEEFAVLFPNMPVDQARQCCEQLRRAVESLDCSTFAPGCKMALSGGVADRTGLVPAATASTVEAGIALH
jgi:diguanylate cyclase (GGDEF)-like protein